MTTRIHDYRHRYWGHDYSLTPDPDPVTARIVGWGHHLREGDLLIIPRPDEADKAAFYRIESLRYQMDPDDMWFSTCRFTPASSALGQLAIEAMTGPIAHAQSDPLSGWWEIPEDAEGAGTPAPTRVYTLTGRVAHLLAVNDSPSFDDPALCGRKSGEWLGTGSQAEFEKAAALPTCAQCAAESARNPWADGPLPRRCSPPACRLAVPSRTGRRAASGPDRPIRGDLR